MFSNNIYISIHDISTQICQDIRLLRKESQNIPNTRQKEKKK